MSQELIAARARITELETALAQALAEIEQLKAPVCWCAPDEDGFRTDYRVVCPVHDGDYYGPDEYGDELPDAGDQDLEMSR